MKRFIFMVAFMILLVCSTAEATIYEYVYQEAADSISCSDSSGYTYFNFSKSDSDVSFLWQVKFGYTPVYTNITTPNGCYNQSIAQYRFWSKFWAVGADRYSESYGQCYDGTTWNTITSVESTPGLPTATYGGTPSCTLVDDGNWDNNVGWYSGGNWYENPSGKYEASRLYEQALWKKKNGLNVSVYDNVTGLGLTNWTITIQNATTDMTFTNQNNPTYFNLSSIPYGNIDINITDGSDLLCYHNASTTGINNETYYNFVNISLQPKLDNPITLTSSSGISLYDGDTTTISCSVAIGSPQLSINNINVSIPYTLTVEQGQYSVLCEVDETENHSAADETLTITVNPLVACTNNNTFAFKKTITPESNLTTLNFTDVVPTHYMKSDLSDVYVPGANNTWINFTDGYYVIVNNTGMSSIDVYFGNYFANRTYSTHALSDNVSLIEGHTQINPAAVYTLRDELNGEEMFPPGATLTSIIQCSQGESYIPINGNDTKFLIASNDYITKALLRVSYTADSYYSRQFYPSEQDMLLLNFYLADAYVNAIDRIDFKMLDSDQYSSKLQAYKTVADTSVVITEGYFDVSRYYSAYLLEDSDYYLRTVEADGTITEYGRITVVEPAVKEIGLASMQLNPESVLIAKKITMNAWANDERTSLYVVYEDLMNQTNDLNITVYHENGTVFQNEHYVDTNSVTLEYNITDFSNDTFTVSFSVEHDTFGNSPVTYFVSVSTSTMWNLGVSSYVYTLISLIMVVLVGGIATRKSMVAGVIMFVITILILRAIGWLSVMSDVSIVFVILLCIIGIFVWIKQGGE